MDKLGWTLVTGGAKGLGAAICKTLAKSGQNILVHYNTSLEGAERVIRECRHYGVNAELIQGNFSTPTKTEEFAKRLIQEFSGVHHLINNVGYYLNKAILQTSLDEWGSLYQVNFLAPFALSQALLPGIKLAKGCIINIGVSGLHGMHSTVTSTAYGATKHSLYLLTKSLARELAPFHVRVNMVSPGQLENSIDRPEDMSKIPMGRLGTLAEVAQTIAFLLDKENAYITGQNIDISGGL